MSTRRYAVLSALPLMTLLASPGRSAELPLTDMLAPYVARYELPAVAAAAVHQ